MGVYINPEEGTKEDWLKAHATKVDRESVVWDDLPEGELFKEGTTGMATSGIRPQT